jgi:hypothetical protein
MTEDLEEIDFVIDKTAPTLDGIRFRTLKEFMTDASFQELREA